jgi:N-terminal domain of galactosyltransferase
LSKHEASYILTYRQGDDSARRENLFAVLAWLANYPQFEVIIVEQDIAPCLQGPLPHSSARHVFLYNPGPFNKSWGFNVGFRLSDRPWFAFGDADVIVGDALPEALAHLRSGYQAAKPYRRLMDLDADETARVTAGEFDWLPARATDAQGREAIGEHLVFAGGLFLIARPTFVRVGGWDERFRGWGGEDDAMSYKLERVRAPAVELDRRPALHLHHARPASQTMGQRHYASNRAVLADYPRLSDAELARFAEVQMQVIGHREKYRPQ